MVRMHLNFVIEEIFCWSMEGVANCNDLTIGTCRECTIVTGAIEGLNRTRGGIRNIKKWRDDSCVKIKQHKNRPLVSSFRSYFHLLMLLTFSFQLNQLAIDLYVVY